MHFGGGQRHGALLKGKSCLVRLTKDEVDEIHRADLKVKEEGVVDLI